MKKYKLGVKMPKKNMKHQMRKKKLTMEKKMFNIKKEISISFFLKENKNKRQK